MALVEGPAAGENCRRGQTTLFMDLKLNGVNISCSRRYACEKSRRTCSNQTARRPSFQFIRSPRIRPHGLVCACDSLAQSCRACAGLYRCRGGASSMAPSQVG